MKPHRLATVLLLAVTASFTPAPPAQAGTPDPVDTASALEDLPSAVLADLSGSERAVLDAATPGRGERTREVSVVRTTGGQLRIDAVTVAAGDATGVARLLDGQPSVEYASVAQPVRAFADPYAGSQWALPRLRADEVRTLQGAAAPAVVAVLDTGVDATHPDLDDVLVAGTSILTRGVGLPADGNGHGTHVSGIIGAEVGNGIGGEGLLAGVRIMPVKVLGDDGSGTTSGVAQGVVWAVDHGADVINMSLGGPASDPALLSAIEYAESRDVVVAAAMGNEHASGNPTSYPAAYPSVLAVGATDSADARGSFSNTGAHIDVVAPGVSILSTLPGGYGYASGTSMATPYAAAAAAAVRAKHPALTAAQVRARLTATAQDLGAEGFDPSFGWGIIDPASALTASALTTAPAVPGAPASVTVTPADRSLGVSWSVAGAAISSYRVTATDSSGAVTSILSADTSATLAGLANGADYQVRVEASNDQGTGPASSAVSARPRTTPGAPVVDGANAGDGWVALTWRAPGADGGSPITGYQVTARTPSQVPVVQVTAAGATSATLTGLVNGASYELSVLAQNAAGFSAAAQVVAAPLAPPVIVPLPSPVAPPAAAPVIEPPPAAAPLPPAAAPPSAPPPSAPPRVPYLSKVVAGNGRAGVYWSPAAGAVSSYRITVTRRGYPARHLSVPGGRRGVTVTALANGAAYAVRVQAVGVLGASGYSRALPVAPRAVPAAARAASVISGPTSDRSRSITVTWTAPASVGGSPVRAYVVRLRRAGTSQDVVRVVPASRRQLSITGLDRGARYTATVQARNLAGAGPVSSRSAAALAR